MDIVNAALERYALDHSAATPPIFKKLIEETRRKTNLPQMQVGPSEGRFLKFLVQLSRAKKVLEIGTFTGYSALAMAEGLPAGGSLVTLDIDPINTMIARKFWRLHPAGRKIKLQIGPALDALKRLKGPFDLVFIDADKQNYWNYWNACLPKVRRGGLLVVDNVLWSGRVLRPKETSDHAIVRFNKRVKTDRRVEALMLPIRDGITLAVKR